MDGFYSARAAITSALHGLICHRPAQAFDRLGQGLREAGAALTECDRNNRVDPGRGPSHLVHRVDCTDEDTLSSWNADIASLRHNVDSVAEAVRQQERWVGEMRTTLEWIKERLLLR